LYSLSALASESHYDDIANHLQYRLGAMYKSVGLENPAGRRLITEPLNHQPHVHKADSAWADRIGIWLSAACAVHCALTPAVLLLLPTIEIASYHEMLHRSLFVVLPLIAILAFIPGYRRHGDRRIFLWSVPGFALLALSAFHGSDDPYVQAAITISGSVLLIRAHYLNRVLSACCRDHAPKFKAFPASAKSR
jgi:hypothetical protein